MQDFFFRLKPKQYKKCTNIADGFKNIWKLIKQNKINCSRNCQKITWRICKKITKERRWGIKVSHSATFLPSALWPTVQKRLELPAWKSKSLVPLEWHWTVWKKEGNQVNFECKRHNNYFLKVSKSQKHFFLKLHCQANEWNIWQNSALASYGRILYKISFIFWVMEFQEKMLLSFT